MLDITLFRDSKTREIIKKSEKNRFKDESIVDKIYELDQERIKTNFELDRINSEVNKIQTKIKEEYKNESSDKNLIEEMKNMSLDIKKNQADLKCTAESLKEEIDRLIYGIGNILEDEVPISKDDDGNVLVRKHDGFRKPIENPKPYFELMKCYTNPESGADVVGHRGYFLQGKMALLARALKNYAIDFLVSKEYEFIQTPVMMRREVMALTSQLSDFDDQLYKIEGDLYLIATSEQPMTALFRGKTLTDNDLPKIFAGESLCFRKEAGAYGKDNSGIFRVHQFDKIEQFVLCKPEDSTKIHEKLVEVSEEFYKSLGLTYQVVLISSGEMNDAASKKYDLEAWFPNSQKFRELVSASNCTDYQSRNLSVKYGYPQANKKISYVHMLNATLCAVQRTLCCIVENYQEEDKIIVPEVLRKYTNFDHIEF